MLLSMKGKESIVSANRRSESLFFILHRTFIKIVRFLLALLLLNLK